MQIDDPSKVVLTDLFTKIKRNSGSRLVTLSGARQRMAANIAWSEAGLSLLATDKPDTIPPPTPDPEPSDWPWPHIPEPQRPTRVVTSGGALQSDTVYKGVDFAGIWVNGSMRNIWLEGGDLGPLANGVHSHIAPDGGICPSNIVLDGVRIHDMTRSITTGPYAQHTEGLQIGGVNVLIIRNCIFENNHVYDLFLRCWDYTGINYVLIENNFFGRVGSGGYFTVHVAGGGSNNPEAPVDRYRPQNIVVRNNRYQGQNMQFDEPSYVKAYGNVKVP